MSRTARGFSLIEILLALAIVGIIASIAIPSYLGSRERARYIGDAKANAQLLAMNLETYKADHFGIYPDPALGPYKWVQGVPPDPNPVPSQTSFAGSTTMDFTLVVNADRISYTIAVTDPKKGDLLVLTMNQNGQIL